MMPEHGAGLWRERRADHCVPEQGLAQVNRITDWTMGRKCSRAVMQDAHTLGRHHLSTVQRNTPSETPVLRLNNRHPLPVDRLDVVALAKDNSRLPLGQPECHATGVGEQKCSWRNDSQSLRQTRQSISRFADSECLREVLVKYLADS
jgi:hypothetical protein